MVNRSKPCFFGTHFETTPFNKMKIDQNQVFHHFFLWLRTQHHLTMQAAGHFFWLVHTDIRKLAEVCEVSNFTQISGAKIEQNWGWKLPKVNHKTVKTWPRRCGPSLMDSFNEVIDWDEDELAHLFRGMLLPLVARLKTPSKNTRVLLEKNCLHQMVYFHSETWKIDSCNSWQPPYR